MVSPVVAELLDKEAMLDMGLDAGLVMGKHGVLGAFARALVGCVVAACGALRTAVAWKPLHGVALGALRSDDVHVRNVGVEIVA